MILEAGAVVAVLMVLAGAICVVVSKTVGKVLAQANSDAFEAVTRGMYGMPPPPPVDSPEPLVTRTDVYEDNPFTREAVLSADEAAQLTERLMPWEAETGGGR